MDAHKISGTIEFVSTKGERGGIDAQINDWLEANPDATIVDVEYRVIIYQDGVKNKLAKLALVMFHKDMPEPGRRKRELTARTMVKSLREGLVN